MRSQPAISKPQEKAPKQPTPKGHPAESKIGRIEAVLKVLGQEHSDARSCLESTGSCDRGFEGTDSERGGGGGGKAPFGGATSRSSRSTCTTEPILPRDRRVDSFAEAGCADGRRVEAESPGSFREERGGEHFETTSRTLGARGRSVEGSCAASRWDRSSRNGIGHRRPSVRVSQDGGNRQETSPHHRCWRCIINDVNKWCKAVCARYGYRGVKLGEARNLGPPKRFSRTPRSRQGSALSFSTNRFEIFSSLIPSTVPATSQAMVRMTESAGDLEAAHPEFPRPRVKVPASFLPTVVDPVDPTHADSEVGSPTMLGSTKVANPSSTFPVSSAAVRAAHGPEVIAMSDGSDTESVHSVRVEALRARPRRRLVIVSLPEQEVFSDNDTESLSGASQVEEVPMFEPTPFAPPVALEPRRRQMADAFTTLDPVDLKEVFKCRANVIRVVPHVVRGAFKLAIRAALEEVIAGHEMHNEVRMGRGWKLLMLLPRMLLNRPRRGGHIPRRQLENRFRRFQEGE